MSAYEKLAGLIVERGAVPIAGRIEQPAGPAYTTRLVVAPALPVDAGEGRVPDGSSPAANLFDGANFGAQIRAKLDNTRLSFRKACCQIPCSPATLNRVARGEEPNVENYLRISRWLCGASLGECNVEPWDRPPQPPGVSLAPDALAALVDCAVFHFFCCGAGIHTREDECGELVPAMADLAKAIGFSANPAIDAEIASVRPSKRAAIAQAETVKAGASA